MGVSMDEDKYEKLARFVRRKCNSCGEMVDVELYLTKDKGLLRLYQEGLCSGCGKKIFGGVPEVVLVMDEQARRMLAN